MRALIVVFDALRPEFVTPDLMPNLSAFAAAGARYSRARSTFPTETRVNQSAVITGCMPHRHGIVGNKFIADDLLPGTLVNSGNDEQLERAFAAGPVLSMPTMGQRLTGAGRRFAALSAGTPGGGRLINWSAEQDGTFRFAMRRPDAAHPADALDWLTDRVGPMPEYALPATDWIGWAVDAYLAIETAQEPDAMVLWLCEPDESFHWHGIGGHEARITMAHADAEFGRLLDRLAPQIEQGLHIFALSDHGQITLKGERLDLETRLTGAGFAVSRSTMGGHDAVLAVDAAGGIWVRDRDPGLTGRIAEWLQAQPWCGPLFSRVGLPGTLPSAELRVDHARAPDLSLVLRADTAPNAHGIAGSTVHDAPYPIGGGCHGGLSASELHTFLALGGTNIRPGLIDAPAGNIDILPTVLHLLGLPTPTGIDGRCLTEALQSGPDPAALTWQDHTLTSAGPGPRTVLSVTEIGQSRYLNAAWREYA